MNGEEKNDKQMEVDATTANPSSNKNTPERPKRTTKPFSAAKLLGLAVKPKDSTKLKSPQKRKSMDTQKNTKEDKVVLSGDQISPSSAPLGQLLKPFQLGWRREIVYRGVQKTKSAKQSDIYYFTPDKIKLRSLPMIIDYLSRTGSDLSKECFSFSKQRIFKEPEEIVRDAGKSRNSLNNSVASAFETSISEIDAKTPKIVKSEKKEPKRDEPLQKSEKKRGRKSLALINHENLQDDVKKIFTEVTEIVKTPVKKRGRKKRKFSEVKSDDDVANKTIKKTRRTDEEPACADSKNLKIDEFEKTVQNEPKTDVLDKTDNEKDSSKTVEKKPKTEEVVKAIKKKINSVETSKPEIKKKIESQAESEEINAIENNEMSNCSPKKDIIKKKFTEETDVLKTKDEKKLHKREERLIKLVKKKKVENNVDEENTGMVKDLKRKKKFEKNNLSKSKDNELSTPVGNDVKNVDGKNELTSLHDHASSFQEDKSIEQLYKVTDSCEDNVKVKNSELKNKTNDLNKNQLKTTDAKENKKRYKLETSSRPVISSVMCDFCMNHLSNKYLNNFNSGSKGIMCEACKTLTKESQFLEYPTFDGKNKKASDDDDVEMRDNKSKSDASSRPSVGEEAVVENQVLSIDLAITSVLDISKKFFLCVNDTKIPVEPSNVCVKDTLNIGLGQCPLPKELLNGNLFALQFSVDTSGDVQMLNATVANEL